MVMSIDLFCPCLLSALSFYLGCHWTVGERHQERAVRTGQPPGKLGWQCLLLPTDVAESLAGGYDAILKTLKCLLWNRSQSGESGLAQAKRAV